MSKRLFDLVVRFSPLPFSAVIWLGDLNYRIAIINETPNNPEFSHARHDNELVRQHATNANLDWLLSFDEVVLSGKLRLSRSAFAAKTNAKTLLRLYGLQRATNHLPANVQIRRGHEPLGLVSSLCLRVIKVPTCFRSEKQRAPAYTDRVLYRTTDAQISPSFYESVVIGMSLVQKERSFLFQGSACILLRPQASALRFAITCENSARRRSTQVS